MLLLQETRTLCEEVQKQTKRRRNDSNSKPENLFDKSGKKFETFSNRSCLINPSTSCAVHRKRRKRHLWSMCQDSRRTGFSVRRDMSVDVSPVLDVCSVITAETDNGSMKVPVKLTDSFWMNDWNTGASWLCSRRMFYRPRICREISTSNKEVETIP